MAHESDLGRKLKVTSAFLGCRSRKDLAARFRAVNPATSFDVERANKWIQGKAQPRDAGLLEDWVKVLGLDRPPAWLAGAGVEQLVDELVERHGGDATALRREAGLEPVPAAAPPGSPLDLSNALVGTYVTWSHAWSPYFRGRLIRGALSITAGERRQPLRALYVERLPIGEVRATGPVRILPRSLIIDLLDPASSAPLIFVFVPPAPPVSTLAGFMTGAPYVSPEPDAAVSRLLAVRVPAPPEAILDRVGYLEPEADSPARDLARLGLPVSEPEALDGGVEAFMAPRPATAGVDQTGRSQIARLIAVFDRLTIAREPTAA
jgi:hypothetical protein